MTKAVQTMNQKNNRKETMYISYEKAADLTKQSDNRKTV